MSLGSEVLDREQVKGDWIGAWLGVVSGQNPDLGVLTPRPPIEEQDAKRPGAAPQTPLHDGLLMGSLARSALASQRESICGWWLGIEGRT